MREKKQRCLFVHLEREPGTKPTLFDLLCELDRHFTGKWNGVHRTVQWGNKWSTHPSLSLLKEKLESCSNNSVPSHFLSRTAASNSSRPLTFLFNVFLNRSGTVVVACLRTYVFLHMRRFLYGSTSESLHQGIRKQCQLSQPPHIFRHLQVFHRQRAASTARE